MIRILVRSRKDRDAVRACIERVVRDPEIEVVSLGGFRDSERIEKLLIQNIAPDRLNIVLSGREDEELFREVLDRAPPNTVLYVVSAKKVRNLRIEHLAWEISRAKALFRNRVLWSTSLESYVLEPGHGLVRVVESSDPATDVYLCTKPGCVDIMNSVTGLDRELYLVVRGLGGLAEVYYGPHRVAEVRIPDCFHSIELLKRVEPPDSYGLSLERVADANRGYIAMLESIARRFLERHCGDAKRVAVPWSGGKDSTAVLTLVRDVVEHVVAVYVDTGVDFPENMEYVEELSTRLGVELIVERAPVREELEHGKPLPTHDNRWCTALKIGAILRAVKRAGVSTVVVGDRDAESRARGLRPFVRVEDGIKYLYPIKLWSTLHVQIYLAYRNIPPNPLYEAGFYRIGCYVCPSLRSWELIAMRRIRSYAVVSRSELFKKFVRMKAAECSRG